MRVDLNADLGEGVTDDEGLLRVVTSANVACGFHAGDEATMRAVCRVAARTGVVVGAQVSYDDREHFGRRHLDVESDVLETWVSAQVGVLSRIAEECGTRVAYLKPHGALYNRIVDDEQQAAAVLRGSGALPVLGLPGAQVLRLAAAAGRRTVREGFPDRGYTDDGAWYPATSRARWSRAPPPSPPTPWPWRATSSRCACTVTHRGRWTPRTPCGRPSSRRGTTSGRGRTDTSTGRTLQAVENPVHLWRAGAGLCRRGTYSEHVGANPCQRPAGRVDISHRVPPGARSGPAKLILSRARA